MRHNKHKKNVQVSIIFWLPFLAIVVILGIAITGLSLNILYEQENQEVISVTDKPKKVIAIGDIACSPDDKNFNGGQGTDTNCLQEKIAKLIQAEKPDAILLLGDIQYEQGKRDAFEKSFIKAWPDKNTPFIAVPGNHEYNNGQLDGYNVFRDYYTNTTAFGPNLETYFSAAAGEWNITGLDTNCEFVGGCDKQSPQGKWLEENFLNLSGKCSLALMHHPVFTSGLHRDVQSTNRGKSMWRQLERVGVEIMLVGHEHNYERFAPQTASGLASSDGIQQFVVGTGGKSLYKTFPPFALNSQKRISTYGYLKLLLSQDQYQWSFIDSNNKALDSGSRKCY